jgi:hypothetical protein
MPGHATVRRLVDASLDGLCRNRSTVLPRRVMHVVRATCCGDPVCALVVAVFESAAWQSRVTGP